MRTNIDVKATVVSRVTVKTPDGRVLETTEQQDEMEPLILKALDAGEPRLLVMKRGDCEFALVRGENEFLLAGPNGESSLNIKEITFEAPSRLGYITARTFSEMCNLFRFFVSARMHGYRLSVLVPVSIIWIECTPDGLVVEFQR